MSPSAVAHKVSNFERQASHDQAQMMLTRHNTGGTQAKTIAGVEVTPIRLTQRGERAGDRP